MMGMIACCMVIFALLLAKWQTAKLIYPINHLNLAEPLENDMYEELTPLLQSIDKQNREKDAVANMRKRILGKCFSRIKNTAYLYFRLCGDYEKRTGKTGRYEDIFRAHLQ